MNCSTAPGTAATTPAAEPKAAVGVLIVDDQPPFRSVARTLVSMIAGWRVVGEAATGEEAVSAAAQVRPDLILMDINLPGINGIEATRRILADRPEVKVALVSTYAADDLPSDAMECGAAGYLRKEDLSPRALREMLAKS
jgi:two-component system, NarL family, invasion response regulator UvrY